MINTGIIFYESIALIRCIRFCATTTARVCCGTEADTVSRTLLFSIGLKRVSKERARNQAWPIPGIPVLGLGNSCCGTGAGVGDAGVEAAGVEVPGSSS